MGAIDDKILETLNDEDKKILNSCGQELGMFGLIAESFRGKLKAIVFTVIALVLIFAVILIISAVNFFTVEDIELKLNWMAVGLTALIVIGLLVPPGDYPLIIEYNCMKSFKPVPTKFSIYVTDINGIRE